MITDRVAEEFAGLLAGGMNSKNYVHTVATRKVTTELDFFPTPARATQALLTVESFDGTMWEPACGDGAISKVLEGAGHTVISNDLGDYGFGTAGVDFLRDHTTVATHIVTNPPYKHLQAFVEHALARVPGKVVMLGRIQLLEGKRRQTLHEKMSRIWVFRRRLQLLRNGTDAGMGGGGMVCFAWFVWDPHHRGPAQLGWLP